jgi:hypothetical protein
MTTKHSDSAFQQWDTAQGEDLDRTVELLRALNAAYSARFA